MPDSLPLAGRTVVLGVGGSVSAYKAADLCSKLVQAGARVLPILTPGACRFVAPATFWGLSSEPVAVATDDTPFGQEEIAHLVYAEQGDIFVIAPASADLLARMASGVCDDMLTAALIANIEKPVLVAPAMNSDMWRHPATQRSRRVLEGYGYLFIEPGVGRLAEGIVGAGRLAEPSEILDVVTQTLNGRAKQDLADARILVTAGPTREPIDPVRYITNHSSGKQGYAIAAAAVQRGASVVLITGPTNLPLPAGVKVEHVNTAQEMRDTCERYANDADVIVAAAAVSDYAPSHAAAHKIKKTGEDGQSLSLVLDPTPDILAGLGGRKRAKQIIVGFAAETDNLQANAQRKLLSKNADLIVANDVTQEGAGFDGDTNIVTFLSRDGAPQNLPLMSKTAVAHAIWDWVAAHRL